MKRSYMAIIVLICGIIGMFLFSQTYADAAQKVPDVIKMENKKYTKHRYPIINFTHKKHTEDYKAKCGNCHHDDKGKPLNNIKLIDRLQSCIDCHSVPGRKPRGERLSPKEKLKYHAEALHKNCKDCHKKYNRKNRGKAGFKKSPVTCRKCHKK